MRLSELIEGMPISGRGEADPDVAGVVHDSRRVRPGDLFVAFAGERFDGLAFASEARELGAAAVLAEGTAPPGFHGTWLRTPDPRAVLGPLAARLHGHPDRELLTAAVTGTNGKSTVVALLAAIFEADDRPAGILGTLGYRFRGEVFAGERTTPEASDLFWTLRQMRERGAEAVAMEASSHALAMGRLTGAAFDLAVFTNLGRDHLDFHRDPESYFAAKRRLFSQLKPQGRAVVNASDPYGRRLAAEVPRALSFGAGGAVTVREVELDERGIRGTLVTPRGELPFTSPLLGDYNLENLLAAVAGAEALDLPPEAIREGISGRGPLPGRMEPVEAGQAFPVFVDYAHTEAALAAAARSVKSFTGCRLVLVFGCGGERDPGKRRPMGRVAGELAERPILTSDNPRREDPKKILAAVEEGLRESGNRNYRVVPDRRDAIRRGLSLAGPGWAVLVAGKGHEAVQIVGEREIPFSDREEIVRALEENLGRTADR